MSIDIVKEAMFTQIGKYALRIMAHLAQQPRDDMLRAREIAESTGVPKSYVSKVLQRLTEFGLLISKKGHYGGFCLARAPEDIRLGEVLAAVNAQPAQKVCVFGWGKCNPKKPCSLHGVWSELSGDVSSWAQRTTLGDVSGVLDGVTPNANDVP